MKNPASWRDFFYCLLLNGDFIYALLMATAFEGCSKELVHNLTSHVVVDETTRHHEHVSIVVLTDEIPSPEPQMAMPGYTSPLSMPSASA